MGEIIHRSISDNVNVQSTALGLDANDDFFIENYKINVTDGGAVVRCLWELKSEDPTVPS